AHLKLCPAAGRDGKRRAQPTEDYRLTEQKTGALPKTCLHCGGTELYVRRTAIVADSFNLLAGLGAFMHYARCDVVLCAGCGLSRLFAEALGSRECQVLREVAAVRADRLRGPTWAVRPPPASVAAG